MISSLFGSCCNSMRYQRIRRTQRINCTKSMSTLHRSCCALRDCRTMSYRSCYRFWSYRRSYGLWSYRGGYYRSGCKGHRAMSGCSTLRFRSMGYLSSSESHSRGNRCCRSSWSRCRGYRCNWSSRFLHIPFLQSSVDSFQLFYPD